MIQYSYPQALAWRNEYEAELPFVQRYGYLDMTGNQGVPPEAWGAYGIAGTNGFPRQFWPGSMNPNLEPDPGDLEPSIKLGIDINGEGVIIRDTAAIADSARFYANLPASEQGFGGMSETLVNNYYRIQTSPTGEGEIAIITAAPSAIYTPGALQAIQFTRGLGWIGVGFAVARLSYASYQAGEASNPQILTDQVGREAGGVFGAVIGGALTGAAYGAAGGAPTGPGAILTGAGGALVGGYLGYTAADALIKSNSKGYTGFDPSYLPPNLPFSKYYMFPQGY